MVMEGAALASTESFHFSVRYCIYVAFCITPLGDIVIKFNLTGVF